MHDEALKAGIEQLIRAFEMIRDFAGTHLQTQPVMAGRMLKPAASVLAALINKQCGK